MVYFKVSSPVGIGRGLDFGGKKDGAYHVGREPGSRAEFGVTVLHDEIKRRKVKIPGLFHDLPSRNRREGRDSV